MSVLGNDIEVARNLFFVGVLRFSDDKQVRFEMSERAGRLDHERLRKVLLANTSVGFNFASYDAPLLWYAIHLCKTFPDATALQLCAKIKAKSDAIIAARARAWQVEDIVGVKIPRKMDFIDLIETQPNAIASLKTLNGRMHGDRMQDIPFDPEAWLSDEEIDSTIDYCMNSDLPATKRLYEALREPLELRVALGAEYGMDFRSKSDSQIGEAIVKKRVEQISGTRAQKVETKPGTTFPYRIPSYLQFETPDLQTMLERLRETEFVVNDKGKVDLPAWLSDEQIVIGETTYQMGIGGLHSTESNRAIHSDEDHALKDFDVAAYYPSIILQSGLFPKSLGKPFLDAYRKIRDERVEAKRKGQALKKELAELVAQGRTDAIPEIERQISKEKVKDAGGKIMINGCFGKLGSRYSILYAPHLMIAVTLTGQLALLMLVERAEMAGVSVVSGNTDGVVFRCPVEKQDDLYAIVRQWEAETGFELEETEYISIYNQSVNSYYALKKDGGHKRKGPLANPWNKDPSDYDPRAQLMKNPQATICSDAALNLIKHGTPIEDTIYGCTDIKQFVTVIKADGGATWRDGYLGKVVRYYWSTNGDPIFKAKAHPKTGNRPMVPKTEGCAPCMTLPDELPDDLDYERYLKVTREILMDIGFDRRPPPPPKLVRMTKANTIPILHLWALVT